MHRIILLFLAALAMSTSVTVAEEIWHLEINDALDVAKQLKRPVVISIEEKGCICLRDDARNMDRLQTGGIDPKQFRCPAFGQREACEYGFETEAEAISRNDCLFETRQAS